MGTITIRPVAESDAPYITAIYNQGIEDRIATLETAIRNTDERLEWMRGRNERTPIFVAERDGEIVAWGALNTFNPRPAYRYVADFSIYVARDARGTGVGSALLQYLIEEARRLSYHKLVLAAFPFNEAGLRLYTRHGFREVGIYQQQGVLDGQWVDTIIMELLLDHNPPAE